MHIKKMFMRLILVIEMFVFGKIYFFGVNGIAALQEQKEMISILKKSVDTLDCEIIQLNESIGKWNADPFYKEKVAREQLQMARKGDELFYVKL